MKKMWALVSILSAISLLGCTNSTTTSTNQNNGGGTYSQNNGGGNTPTPTTSVSEKTKVINYFKSKGTYSDGDYLIAETTPSSNDTYYYTKIDMLIYSPSKETFGVVWSYASTKKSTGNKTSMMAASSFSWGSYDYGTFFFDLSAGSYETIYSLSSLSFESDGEIDNCKYTVTKDTFSWSSSELKEFASTCLKGYNEAASWATSELAGYGSLR
jgi:hypothetical protein